MTDRPTTEPHPLGYKSGQGPRPRGAGHPPTELPKPRAQSASERLANAAEMLLHWTRHPDDPAYRHWFAASRADLQRELDAFRAEAAQGAAPRAEGLPTVDDLAAAMWAERDRLDSGIDGANEVLYQRAARAILADLSGRPSDERVPESEEPR